MGHILLATRSNEQHQLDQSESSNRRKIRRFKKTDRYFNDNNINLNNYFNKNVINMTPKHNNIL